MPILYIVATPIGNLEDMTFRALKILKEVDLILCEDTRVTKKLLAHYEIKTPTLSYHQHSKLTKINYILELLKEGKNLALVSDAGTPGISDPGNKLIAKILELSQSARSYALCQKDLKAEIIPIPGSSAITAAASISGFPMDKFLFLGFPPTKRKREKFFREVINSKYPVIFYESPYRIIKSLRDLRETDAKLNAKQTRNIVVCRELTKKFETIYRGRIEEVIENVKKNPIKGEFVVIVGK
jgi:16S rRNA (cytidine1402-2'-O)-methyltransferase